MSEKRRRKSISNSIVKTDRKKYSSDKSRATGKEMYQEHVKNSDETKYIVTYADSSSDDESSQKEEKTYTSYNVCDYVKSRESGLNERNTFNYFEQTTRSLLTHNILREIPIDLGYTDKIFCSKWLSERQVVFGTKCNKLLVYDINKSVVDAIPLLHSNTTHRTDPYTIQGDGLHAIDVNPNRTFLATGAYNSGNIAVYRLPGFEPTFLGENGHHDTIMGMCWLDDQFLISGSKDSRLALWRIFNDNDSSGVTFATITNPLSSIKCQLSGEGIRSLCFNNQFKEIAAISYNGFIHIFNAETFKQKLSRKLPYCPDIVSIAYHGDGIYAIGCRLYMLLIDARTLQTIKKVTTRYNGCGIRALSFHGNLLTIGTGLGMLLFYDLRAGEYLQRNGSSSGIVALKCSKGKVYSEDEMDGFQESKYSPTIYTHCYDSTGSRLFVAGGPFSSTLVGNYAGVWQ